MSENLILFFFKQILDGLKYFRIMGLLHKDIKPQNILLGNNYQVKFCDFSISSCMPTQGYFDANSAGTFEYTSPECIFNESQIPVKEAFKIDYYSVGIILYNMLFNKLVITREKDRNITSLELNKKLDFICEQNTDGSCKDLISRLIEKDYKKRIDFRDIISHSWVNKNNKSIQHLKDLHENDPSKLIIELQKTDNNMLLKKEFYGNGAQKTSEIYSTDLIKKPENQKDRIDLTNKIKLNTVLKAKGRFRIKQKVPA